MLLGPIMTVFLLGCSVIGAPTNSSSPTVDRSAADDDPLETSETGHSRRRRLWRRLLKQFSGMGQGGYDLGGYGLGVSGLNFLSQIAHFQGPNTFAHCGPHRGQPEFNGGVGGGYGGNVLHYPAHHPPGGGYYRPSLDFPVNHDLGGVSPAGFGPWDSGASVLYGNYGHGGPDGLHFDAVWL